MELEKKENKRVRVQSLLGDMPKAETTGTNQIRYRTLVCVEDGNRRGMSKENADDDGHVQEAFQSAFLDMWETYVGWVT